MHEPTVVSLCSGCGGLDLGLEQVGYRVVALAELDRDASAVLAARFPGVPNLGDLTQIRWDDVLEQHGRPDVVAAGFPCQPVSLAGRGLVEADPRWLWPEVARCLRVVRPRFVLLENVPGIFRRPPSGGPRPVGVVLSDLAALGYDALWTGLRAADLGAPHGRDRWFCVAALTPDARGGGIDADRGIRRRGAGEPERPAPAALPAGPEMACAADALEDRAGAPADAGRLGLSGSDGRGLEGGGTEPAGGREPAPDAERVAGPQTGERHVGPGADAVEGERGGTRSPVGRIAGRDRREREAPADPGHGGEHLGTRPAGRQAGERVAERPGLGADGRATADADSDVSGRDRGAVSRAEGEGAGRGGSPEPCGRVAIADADVEGRERPEPERARRRGRPADGGQTAPDAGRDGFVRVEALDGEDGRVDVERGDDADRRDLGGAGAGDGHAGEAPADAGRRRWGGGQDVEGEGPAGRGGPRGDGEDAADADGAGEESGCGRRVTRGGRSRRDETLDVGHRYVGPADSEGAATPADAGRVGEPEVVEGYDEFGVGRRERETVGRRDELATGAGADSGASAGDLAARPAAVRGPSPGDEGDSGFARVEWGIYEPAIRRWERLVGRAAPRPTDDIGRLDPRFPEWMLGFPDGWVEIDGVSRTAQLRLIGNAVQVQCGALIGLWLAEVGGFG